MACLEAHYAARDASRAPSECRKDSISGYDIENLSSSLWAFAQTACRANSGAASVTIIVVAYARGDIGCGGGDHDAQATTLGQKVIYCPV